MPDDDDDPEEERDDPRASSLDLKPIRPWRIQPLISPRRAEAGLLRQII